MSIDNPNITISYFIPPQGEILTTKPFGLLKSGWQNCLEWKLLLSTNS